MQTSTSISTTVQLGRKHRLFGLFAVVAAIVAVAVWAIVAYAVDTGSSEPSASTRASVPASLSQSERQWVTAITSMTPAQLQASFGTSSQRAGVLPSLGPKQRQALLHQAMLAGFPGLVQGVGPKQR